MADDCIFCKIVAGEIPSTKVHEDDRTVAFMDVNPGARGHLLVVPREHAADVHEIGDEDLAAVARTARDLAARVLDRLGADGVNIIQNNGSRRLADRLPLPRARAAPLRRRPDPAALDARRPATRTRSRPRRRS